MVADVMVVAMSLTERDQAILDFERGWWTLPGVKETAIREQLGLSATRYYQLLHALTASPDALAYDPLVVRRLRRAHAQRRRDRVERLEAAARSSRSGR
jgi:hypothetical protein